MRPTTSAQQQQLTRLDCTFQASLHSVLVFFAFPQTGLFRFLQARLENNTLHRHNVLPNSHTIARRQSPALPKSPVENERRRRNQPITSVLLLLFFFCCEQTDATKEKRTAPILDASSLQIVGFQVVRFAEKHSIRFALPKVRSVRADNEQSREKSGALFLGERRKIAETGIVVKMNDIEVSTNNTV